MLDAELAQLIKIYFVNPAALASANPLVVAAVPFITWHTTSGTHLALGHAREDAND